MDEAIYNLLYPLLDSQPKLFAIVLVLSISLVGSYYRIRTSSRNAKKLPPGSLGLPFFGESISFFRAQKCDKTQEWIESRTVRYGSIFKTSLMGKPTVVITGSTGNRFLFTANENTVATNQPVTVSSILGKSNTFELGEHDHKLIRGAMSSFLKPESLQWCVGEMDAVIKDQIFQEFNMRDSVKAVPLMKRITFNVTCSVLFGLPIGKELDSLFEDFTTALKGVWSLQLNFPLTSFHQAMAARKRIYAYFSALIHERKKRLAEGNISNENTVITKFLNLRGMDGETVSDDMVIDNIVTLMFASHDTSTTLLIHLIRHLARDKAIYKSVLEEQVRVLGEKEVGGGKLTWDDIQKMKYTWRVSQEMMRITPPVFGNFKRAAKNISFGGFDIPKGWQLFWVSCGTHMDKNIFPEPEKFDPSRFEAASKSYPPYSYIPFGAGPRICPGSEFSRIEVLLVMHHLVRNYEWSEMIPNEPITRDPLPYPVMGLPIKLRAKRKYQDSSS